MEIGPKSMTKNLVAPIFRFDNFEHRKIINVFQMGISWPVIFTKQNQHKEKKQFLVGSCKSFCLRTISSFYILEYKNLYSWFLEKKIASLDIFVVSVNVNS